MAMSVVDHVFDQPDPRETGMFPDPRAPLIRSVKELDDQMVSHYSQMVSPNSQMDYLYQIQYEILRERLHELASPHNQNELNILLSLWEIPALKDTVESVILAMGHIMLPPETLASLGEIPTYNDVKEALKTSPYIGINSYNAETREILEAELIAHRAEGIIAAAAPAQAGLEAMDMSDESY